MKIRYYIAFYAVAALLVGFAIFRIAGPDAAADNGAVADAGQDVVRVQITEDEVISRGQDPVIVQLESGIIPDDVTHLTVTFDGSCQADDDGVSHCENPVEFETDEGTQTAMLRHHHRFSEEPCLYPGTVLEVVR